MKKLKPYLGEIITIAGVAIATYNIFSFPRTQRKIKRFATAYYYNNETILFITIGITLIILGIMIIKRRKHHQNQ